MTLIQHLENHFGTFIPHGGMYEITNAIFNLAKHVGVKFHFNCNVDEIILAIQSLEEAKKLSKSIGSRNEQLLNDLNKKLNRYSNYKFDFCIF